MELRFEVEGVPVVFVRSHITGRAELQVGDETRLLQSPRRLSAHFDHRRRTVWREQVGDHAVEIEKIRPLLFAGFRPQAFIVNVDGQTIAEAVGR